MKYLTIISVFILLFHATGLTQSQYEYFENGKEDFQEGKRQEARDQFIRAIKLDANPNAHYQDLSGQTIEYIPFYWLGRTYLELEEWDKALQNFERAIEHGEIYKTEYDQSIEGLRNRAQLLTKYAEWQETEKPAVNWQNFNPEWLHPERLRQARSWLAKQNPGDSSVIAMGQAIDVVEELQQATSMRQLQSTPPEDTETDSSKVFAASDFNRGLEAFRIERYRPALDYFRTALQLDPEMELAGNWLDRTNAELAALDIESEPGLVPDESSPSDTLRPTITVREPKEQTSRLSNEIALDAVVNFHRGIDSLSIDLNGQSVTTYYPDVDTKYNFPFDITLPLKMDENDINLHAYGSGRKTTTFLNVTRLPAWYTTTTFIYTAGSLIVIPLIVIIITKRIKYRIAIVNKFNPYIAGAPVRDDEMFFGRDQLLKRIINTLHNNSLMLYGPRRIGKTSLQHQLKQRLETLDDPEYWFVPVMIDLQGIDEDQFFTTLIDEAMDSCKKYLPEDLPVRIKDKKETYSARDLSYDFKMVIEHLRTQTRKNLKLVLLIDEVDQLNRFSEQINQKLRSIFMKTFAENLVAVMSGAYIRKSWESEGSPWYNFFEEIEVTPLEKSDAEALITQPVAGIFKYDDDAIQQILKYSGSKPYIIQRLCINVINRIIELKRRHVTVSDVEVVWQKMSSFSNISNM